MTHQKLVEFRIFYNHTILPHSVCHRRVTSGGERTFPHGAEIRHEGITVAARKKQSAKYERNNME